MPLSELPITHGMWLVLVLLGGVFGADAVSWPQVMISRPLVCGTIGGALLGDAGAGFFVGGILELYAMRHPPFGAARYPDTGPAGLVAGAAYAAAGGTSLLALGLALLGGWAVGWIGALSVHARRRVNERLVAPAGELASRPELLERRHRLAIWLDGLRGGFLVASFLVPVAAICSLASAIPAAAGARVFATGAIVLGVAASAGAAARSAAFGIRGWPLLAAGIAGAAMLLAVGA